MSLVESTTLTRDEAAALTDSIRGSVVDLEQKIVRAYFGRAWLSMGYESWDDYVAGEFKRAPLALPREDRKTQVLSLRQQGMSLRAIGTATGVDPVTVRNDLASTVENSTVDIPERVTGLDGRERPTSRAPRALAAPAAPAPQPATVDTPPELRETCPTCGQFLPD